MFENVTAEKNYLKEQLYNRSRSQINVIDSKQAILKVNGTPEVKNTSKMNFIGKNPYEQKNTHLNLKSDQRNFKNDGIYTQRLSPNNLDKNIHLLDRKFSLQTIRRNKSPIYPLNEYYVSTHQINSRFTKLPSI